MIRGLLALLMTTVLAAPAFAGVTKYSTTVAPLPNTCDSSPICAGGSCSSGLGACSADADCRICTVTGEHCTAGADCGNPALSPTSKVLLTGTGAIKVVFKDVMGPGGAPVTTDGILGTADDYIVGVALLYQGGKPKQAFLKLELKDGKGTATADAAGILPPEGSPILPFVELLGPPIDPASCPGANAPADIVARAVGTNCGSGKGHGWGGFLVTEAKTKMKSSVAPLVGECVNFQTCVSGTCNSSGISCSTDADCRTCSNDGETSCATNVDCNAGVPSSASKFQVNGVGDFKMTLTGVLDATGQPLTTDQVAGSADDYVVPLLVTLPPSLSTFHTVYFKTDFDNGKAKLIGNVGDFLPAAGTPFGTYSGVTRPPSVPASCPGTNAPADLTARLDLSACASGVTTGFSGVAAGH